MPGLDAVRGRGHRAVTSTDVASSAERGPGTLAVHSCPRACTGHTRTIGMSAYASLDSTYFGDSRGRDPRTRILNSRYLTKSSAWSPYSSRPMGNVTFALHQLGWADFQSLCHTITREILGQTVVRYLDGNDGGRDGTFSGTWTPAGGEKFHGEFVIQAKHTTKPDSTLGPAAFDDELDKAERLATAGLCDVYVLMTNAGSPAAPRRSFRPTSAGGASPSLSSSARLGSTKPSPRTRGCGCWCRVCTGWGT